MEPPEHETLSFDVEKWDWDYWMMLNNRWKSGDPVGRCFEHRALKLAGPLRRNSRRRRADRIELTLDPTSRDPDQWRQEWKGIGLVQGVRGGTIAVTTYLRMESLQLWMGALAAGKVSRIQIGAERGAAKGTWLVTSFGVADPAEDDSDE